MKPFERDRLLERIDREGATVGTRIPERLSIGDQTVELRSFVHEAAEETTRSERVQEVIRGLRAERNGRRQQIENDDLSMDEAEELAESILGIDRALTVLKSEGETDIEAEEEKRRQADQKRWLSFLQSVTGPDSGSTREERR